jgi:hypothetical protein
LRGRIVDRTNLDKHGRRLRLVHQAGTCRKGDALKMLARIEEYARLHYVEPVVLAQAYAGIGRTEDALSLIEKGYRDHDLDRTG